jgi:hypothetical protein
MNYYEFLKFIQKSAQRKDKGKHFCFGNPGVSRNQLQSRCTIHMSLSFASGTLSCFIFQHEVPGREENRGSRRSFLFRPVGASSAPMEGWGSTRRSSRTRWSPWMAGRGPVAAWPRAHVDGDGGGQWWWHSGGLPPRLSAREMSSTTRRRH